MQETVGTLIARARHRKRITQAQLAQALEVSPSSVADWERGVTYPAKKAGVIEEYLDITLPPRQRRQRAVA